MWNVNGGSEKNYLIRHFGYVPHTEQFMFPYAYALFVIWDGLKKLYAIVFLVFILDEGKRKEVNMEEMRSE